MSFEQTDADRSGAKQPRRFNPASAARLDDPDRMAYLPPERIAELLNVRTGLVLDFGTGTGAYAVPLARLLPRVTVLALDEQPEMLAILEAKLAAERLPNVRLAEPSALASFAGRIDRILAINVLHEVGDRDLEGLPLLLAPDGQALFVDWNAEAERPVGPPADHVYAPAEARARLTRFGFAPARTEMFPFHYAIACRRPESR
jgi:SAM-dependent methyltransferase